VASWPFSAHQSQIKQSSWHYCIKLPATGTDPSTNNIPASINTQYIFLLLDILSTKRYYTELTYKYNDFGVKPIDSFIQHIVTLGTTLLDNTNTRA
jgi:hypothetical protein